MRSQRRLNVDNLLAKPEVLLENGHGKRHDLFVEEVLHQGLRNLCSAADEEQGWLFSPADVEEVFRRCELHGGKVHFISHISESGDNDEYLQVKGDAREAFRGLLEKGCTEKFSLVLKIPQDVVERWWKDRRLGHRFRSALLTGVLPKSSGERWLAFCHVFGNVFLWLPNLPHNLRVGHTTTILSCVTIRVMKSLEANC